MSQQESSVQVQMIVYGVLDHSEHILSASPLGGKKI